MSAKRTDDRRKAMIQSLHECGSRCTPERLSIIDALTEQSGPVSAEAIYNAVGSGSYPVSRATVYNTLGLLVKNGQIVPVKIPGTGSTCYEPFHRGRSQMLFVCEKCGTTRKFDAPQLSKSITSHEFQHGSASRFSLTVYGMCRKCTRKAERMK